MQIKNINLTTNVYTLCKVQRVTTKKLWKGKLIWKDVKIEIRHIYTTIMKKWYYITKNVFSYLQMEATENLQDKSSGN